MGNSSSSSPKDSCYGYFDVPYYHAQEKPKKKMPWKTIIGVLILLWILWMVLKSRKPQSCVPVSRGSPNTRDYNETYYTAPPMSAASIPIPIPTSVPTSAPGTFSTMKKPSTSSSAPNTNAIANIQISTPDGGQLNLQVVRPTTFYGSNSSQLPILPEGIIVSATAAPGSKIHIEAIPPYNNWTLSNGQGIANIPTNYISQLIIT